MLDLSKPTSFGDWASSISRFLDGGDAGVAAMLEQAVKSDNVIGDEWEQRLALDVALPWPASDVSRAIADAIVQTSSPDVRALSDAFGKARGFELWRWLHHKARGQGPQVVRAMQDKLLSRSQPRPTSWAKLQAAMVTQAAAIRDIRQAGGQVSPQDEYTALKLILPEQVVQEVEDKEFWRQICGLADLQRWLSYKIFNAHVKEVVDGKGPRDLHQLEHEAEDNGWYEEPWPEEGYDQATYDEAPSLDAVARKGKNGKGKGKGGKNGRKGPGKEGTPRGAIGPDGLPTTSIPKNFKEGCWHCGGDHRRADCPKFQQQRKAGKFGNPGGKGLRELEQEAGEWHLGQLQEPALGVNYLGGGLLSLHAEGKGPAEGNTHETNDDDDDNVQTAMGEDEVEVRGLRGEVLEREGLRGDRNRRKVRKELGLCEAFRCGGCEHAACCESNRFAALADDGEEEEDQEEMKSVNVVNGHARGHVAATAPLPQSISGLFPYQKRLDKEGPEWKEAGAQQRRKAAKRREKAARRAACTLNLLEKQASGPMLAPVSPQSAKVLQAVVDSGAEDTVFPPSAVPPDAVEPSVMSKKGLKYTAANGAAIANLGQLMLRFAASNGSICAMPAQVAEVQKPLVSVSRLAEAGNDVIFGEAGGVIRHRASGRELPLRKSGNVYYLDMQLSPPGKPSGFAGQGQ